MVGFKTKQHAKQSASSESDSGDETTRLREAVDTDFINDSMFSSKKKKERLGHSLSHTKQESSSQKQWVSLRPTNDDKQYNDLQVTPEFQQFVARHLDKIIDNNLKEKSMKSKPSINQKPSNNQKPTDGIKLLSGSKEYLSETEQNSPCSEKIRNKRKPKRKRISEDTNEATELDKCKQVAVSSDWVLTKEGTKGWAPSFKRNVLVINSKGDIIEER